MKTRDRRVRAAFAPCAHVQFPERASGTASPQGLSRVVGAVPDVAAALGYDVETALLEDLDDH